MVVVKKEDGLDGLFLEEQRVDFPTVDSPNPETSSVWLGQKTVPYHRSDGVIILLTYDIYSCLFDPGKEIYQLRYHPGLIPPF